MDSSNYQPSYLTFLLVFSLYIFASTNALTIVDADALMKFKESLQNPPALSDWDSSKVPCFRNKNNWAGLICSRGGNIWGIRLENMGLKGTFDVSSLAGLSRLRSISVKNNSLDGPVPVIRHLKGLKSIYLSYNNFEGNIENDAFEGMRRLRKVHIAYNKFVGEIPSSLTELPRLVEVRLEGNQFEGKIPDFKGPALQNLNVSNNQLQGPIPPSAAKFDLSAFAGNKELCGPPLNPCPTPPPSPPPTPPTQATRKNSTPIIPIIAAALVAVILVILLILMILHTHVQKHHQGQDQHTSSPQNSHPNPTQLDRGEGSSRKGATTSNRNKADQSGKLTFVARSEKREKFDLSDLLKAAAEILGSGCFGSSYKATLLNGVSVVVKRFKQMNHVGKEEFNEHMRRIGRLDHPNLLPLVAYYYRKEEKLFVTDVVPRGSLAVLLHGRSRGQAALDWVTRLNIIKGVARGLSYLYKELPCLIAPHGHLKSSNVLIDHSFNPLLHDYALIPLINPESAQKLMVAYKSPEFIQTHRISKKTDVWALGILILETLTGKFPASFLHQGSEVDLKSWVDEVVKEGFDEEMEVSEDCEGEMEKMMKIGLECCESDMEKRLDLKEACKRIEHVRERRDDDHGDDDNEKSGDFSVIIN